MDMSDEVLRKELSKYMDNVPAVTGSTREVLKAKLAKFQTAKSTETSPESTTPNGDIDVERRTSKRQTLTINSNRRTTATKSTATIEETSVTPIRQCSPVEQNSTPKSPPVPQPVLNTSQSRKQPFLIEDDEYRVRYFPSSDLPDYPGGVPVFRRRSLHPVSSSEKTSDPYEEFCIRSPRLQGKIDAERIISRVMSGSHVYTPKHHDYDDAVNNRNSWRKSTSHKWWFTMPSYEPLFNFASAVFIGVSSLILAPLTFLKRFSSRFFSTIGFKSLAFLLVVCVLIAMGMFFIISDPFYRNPVSEFADRISVPLASLLQLEHH